MTAVFLCVHTHVNLCICVYTLRTRGVCLKCEFHNIVKTLMSSSLLLMTEEWDNLWDKLCYV